MNKKGEEVIKPKYDRLYLFSEGMTLFGKGKEENLKFGYINKQGKVIIPAKYYSGTVFSEGISICSTEKWLLFWGKRQRIIIERLIIYIRCIEKGRAYLPFFNFCF